MAKNKNRWKIQATATLLSNANLAGFFTGRIYKGNLKSIKVCKMDVEVYKTPNHAECISCGDCVRTCPHGAICNSMKLGKAVLKK